MQISKSVDVKWVYQSILWKCLRLVNLSTVRKKEKNALTFFE